MLHGTLTGRHAVVIGSGIAGLAAARVLADRDARVTLRERDTEPEAATADEAFTAWQRKGAPQVRNSHAFLGRLRTLPPLGRLPGDEDLVAIGCRRTTFEWVLRRNVLTRPGVALLSGANVRRLLA